MHEWDHSVNIKLHSIIAKHRINIKLTNKHSSFFSNVFTLEKLSLEYSLELIFENISDHLIFWYFYIYSTGSDYSQKNLRLSLPTSFFKLNQTNLHIHRVWKYCNFTLILNLFDQLCEVLVNIFIWNWFYKI